MQFAGAIVIEYMPKDVRVTIKKIFFVLLVEKELAFIGACVEMVSKGRDRENEGD